MIINIRGTSGSGKSTIVRAVIEQAADKQEWQPSFDGLGRLLPVNPKTGEPRTRKRPWGYSLDMGEGRRPVIVLGHYETACGGCDTIPNFDLGYSLIQRAYETGSHVLFEGLLYSADATRLINLASGAVPKTEFLIIGLSTSLEECSASVNARRAKSRRAELAAIRGEFLPPVNDRNTLSKFKGTQNTMKRLAREGFRTEWCSRKDARELVLSYFLEQFS